MADFVTIAVEGEALGIPAADLSALMASTSIFPPLPLPEQLYGLRIVPGTDIVGIVGTTVTRTFQMAFGPSETAVATLTFKADGAIESCILDAVLVGNDYAVSPIVSVNPGAAPLSPQARDVAGPALPPGQGVQFLGQLRAFLSVRATAADVGGAGYTPATTVAFFGGLPPAPRIFREGAVGRVYMLKPGLGYPPGTTVSIEGGGAPTRQAQAAITQDAFGRITSITLLEMGAGYSAIPQVRFHPPGGVPVNKVAQAGITMVEGRPASATVTIVLGVVTGFVLTDPGSGYIAVPGMVITDPGGGVGAVGRARMRVERIDVINPGHGYDPATTTVVITPFFKSVFPDTSDQRAMFFQLTEQIMKQRARTPMRSLVPVLA